MRFDLRFLYQPVADVVAAAAFYEKTLGLTEAWREDDGTRAYRLPGSEAQFMVSTDDQPAGPMFQVDDLSAWMMEHHSLVPIAGPYPIPGGEVAGFRTPEGHAFYVFELSMD